MRARDLLAAGMVTAVVAACSKPAPDVVLEDPELAVFSAAAAREAASSFVSAQELARTEAPGPVRAAQPAPRKVAAPRRASPAEPVALDREPQPTLAVAEPEAAPAPMPGHEMIGPIAMAMPGPAEEEGEADAQGPDRAPGILIRGGVSGRDPCVTHRGGAPGEELPEIVRTGGVLVNDRTPPGVVRNTPTYATRGRAGPLGRGTSIRGGFR